MRRIPSARHIWQQPSCLFWLHGAPQRGHHRHCYILRSTQASGRSCDSTRSGHYRIRNVQSRSLVQQSREYSCPLPFFRIAYKFTQRTIESSENTGAKTIDQTALSEILVVHFKIPANDPFHNDAMERQLWGPSHFGLVDRGWCAFQTGRKWAGNGPSAFGVEPQGSSASANDPKAEIGYDALLRVQTSRSP